MQPLSPLPPDSFSWPVLLISPPPPVGGFAPRRGLARSGRKGSELTAW